MDGPGGLGHEVRGGGVYGAVALLLPVRCYAGTTIRGDAGGAPPTVHHGSRQTQGNDWHPGQPRTTAGGQLEEPPS